MFMLWNKIINNLENNGIPFKVMHKVDNDTAISEAIERRKAGVEFLTVEQSLANMRTAIKTGTEYGK